jgi:hypothetical protein
MPEHPLRYLLLTGTFRSLMSAHLGFAFTYRFTGLLARAAVR